MNQDTPSPGDESKPGAAPVRASAGVKRRALLKASAGAAPILLTLHSGPVAATGMGCTVASSFVSAITFASRSPGTTYIKCSSKNAGYWRAWAEANCKDEKVSKWPAEAQIKVKDHLGCSGSTYDNTPLGVVLKLGLASAGQLAVLQYVLGLSLTMQYAPGSITTAPVQGGELNKTYLAGVWSRYLSTGRYSVPSANVDWDEAGLIQWLKMLQYDIPV